jgi:hypothetical protein
MKKILTIGIIALAMLALFTSCQKEKKLDKSLIGTSWQSENVTHEYVILDFSSESSVVYKYYSDYYEGVVDFISGTYTYNPPSIDIVLLGEHLTGTVGTTTMILEGEIYTKL